MASEARLAHLSLIVVAARYHEFPIGRPCLSCHASQPSPDSARLRMMHAAAESPLGWDSDQSLSGLLVLDLSRVPGVVVALNDVSTTEGIGPKCTDVASLGTG